VLEQFGDELDDEEEGVDAETSTEADGVTDGSTGVTVLFLITIIWSSNKVMKAPSNEPQARTNDVKIEKALVGFSSRYFIFFFLKYLVY